MKRERKVRAKARRCSINSGSMAQSVASRLAPFIILRCGFLSTRAKSVVTCTEARRYYFMKSLFAATW